MKYGLFINENIKTWQQTAIRVMAIIMAVIIVLVPVFFYIINDVLGKDSGYSPQDRYEDYIRYANEFGDVRGNRGGEDEQPLEPNPDKVNLESRYWLAMAEGIELFIENDIAQSWQFNMFYNDYSELVCQVMAYRLVVKEGYTKEEIGMASSLGYYLDFHRHPDMRYFYDIDNERYMQINEDGMAVPSDIDAAGFYDILLAFEEAQREFILNASYGDVIQVDIDNYQSVFDASALEVEYLQEQTKSEPDNMELKYSYEAALLRYESAAEQLRLYKYLYEVEADFYDWRYLTVSRVMSNALQQKMATAVMPEEMFWENGGQSIGYFGEGYKDYNSYVESQLNKREQCDEALAILNYSLEEEVPTPRTLEKSAKLSWQDNIPTAINYIRIFMIVLAGTIVASEYSSGSIRLLLIRPKKRYKILTSKLMCSVCWSYALMLAAAVVMLIINIIFYGMSDILVPDLVYTGGRVLEVSGFLVAIWSIIISSLPALFIMSTAFLLSVVTKKAALAIALPLIMNAFGSAVSALSAFIRMKIPLIDYTVLPYSDMSMFLDGVVKNFSSSLLRPGEQISMAGLLTGSLGGWNIVTGAVVLLLHTALMIFLSYYSFVKQQIKS